MRQEEAAAQRPIPPSGRVLGLDLGSRRVGVAVTDGAQAVAAAVATIPAGDLSAVESLAREYEAVGLVVGLPLSLDGSRGHAAVAAAEEAALLAEHLGLPVETSDERLTTVAATAALLSAGRRGRGRRSVVDQAAAVVMLQGWADRRRASSGWGGG